MKRRKSKIVNKKRFYTFIFICIVALTLIISLFFNMKSSFGATTEASQQTYTVRENDTVWKVAKKFDNHKIDIRDFIDIIIEENEIVNSNLIPGETIKIPSI